MIMRFSYMGEFYYAEYNYDSDRVVVTNEDRSRRVTLLRPVSGLDEVLNDPRFLDFHREQQEPPVLSYYIQMRVDIIPERRVGWYTPPSSERVQEFLRTYRGNF